MKKNLLIGFILVAIPMMFLARVFSASFLKTFAADRDGNMIIPFYEPYPHLKKSA